ncbi:MAG TPA: response regulator [Bacilli bacterium]
MKILIADDEELERVSMKKIILDSFADAEIVGLAENGRKAIQYAAETKPDLILMDIRMPGIDGLEAVSAIQQSCPEVKFIIVSAFDQFEYARTALRLGVNDYLLKPSSIEEIVGTLTKVMAQIKKERMAKKATITQQLQLQKLLPIVETDLVAQLLYDQVHEMHVVEMMQLIGADWKSELVVIVLFVAAKQNHVDKSVANEMYCAMKNLLHNKTKGWVGAMSGSQIPAIIFLEKEKSFRSQISVLIRDMLSAARQYPQYEFFIGIGDKCQSIDQVAKSYHEALLSAIDRSLPARHLFFADLQVNSAQLRQIALELKKKAIDYVRLGDWQSVHQALRQLLEHFEKTGVNLVEAQQRLLEALLMIFRLLHDLGFEVEMPLLSYQAQNYQQLSAELQGIIAKLTSATDALKNRVEPDVTQQIKRFIIEHADRDVSLEAIAERFGLSPFYISKIFKEQIGINYIDFLTESRIEKAKNLLANSELSLKEITYQIGYNDPNYFSRVFKKVCGVSPTEYRKMSLRR